MSTTLPQRRAAEVSKKTVRFDGQGGRNSQAPGSGLLGKVLLLIVLVGLLSAAVWGSRHLLTKFSSQKQDFSLTHTVGRGELLITVTEDGNLESASNLDVKCQVAAGSSILWIVPDGSEVKAGDKLVELDSSALDEQINQQRIAYEKARSTRIQAENTFAVAKLAVREYLEGTFKQARQDAEAQITIALENLRSAENSVAHAERMFRKGYVSNLELEGQRFAVERSQLELDSARTAKDVLVNYSKAKMLQDLESQRDTAEAQMKAETASFDLEESRLKRLEAQLAKCTITAPTDGMVVYAQPAGRFGQQQSTIEEGATVRERQTILKLPDLTQMQVKVNVHESKVDQVSAGMRVRVRVLEREKTGTVTSVANQPEPTSWFSANVKEYATYVRIDGEPQGLRPGMTAEVEILVAHLTDVISLPVAAIVQQRGEYYCWVRTTDGVERRLLVLGMSNDQFIEIKDGVVEGDVVLLNPRAVVADARIFTDDDGEKSDDVSARFGEAPAKSPVAPGHNDPAGGAERQGRRPAGGGGGEYGADPSRVGRPADGGSAEGAGRGSQGGGSRGRLMQLDADGDGKVSRDEAPERMKQFFDRLDGNGDGFIDKAEADALRQRSRGGSSQSEAGRSS